jgi:hypothetical protein
MLLDSAASFYSDSIYQNATGHNEHNDGSYQHIFQF